mgnify:CR=1 FL=1
MIAIVDVCSGNLRSVERALAQVGGDVVVTRDPDVVRKADKIVVPGQGAFGNFMTGLRERGLGESLREAIASGRPYLGICLGMQILFDDSEEQGPVAGLGVVRGHVIKLVPGDPALKIPHIGWNRCMQRRPDPMLDGIPDGAHFYFTHSFHALPADPSLLALDAEHGIRITAAIRSNNVFACQFHPEKSQAMGLRLLERFVTS